MNKYTQNINRLEFIVTWACTGKCRHCSEGEKLTRGGFIDGGAAAQAVRRAAEKYGIQSVMTFGGEPLLNPDAVYLIHAAARDAGIPRRQVITNGYFSREKETIRTAAKRLRECGANDVLLSADAFHQEHIPLEPVVQFARALMEEQVPLRISPAWLVGPEADNPWNERTCEILTVFSDMGIRIGKGNIIFPAGNALKYLAEYFDPEHPAENPYEDDPLNVTAVSVGPDGSALNGNICEEDILDIIERYVPQGIR